MQASARDRAKRRGQRQGGRPSRPSEGRAVSKCFTSMSHPGALGPTRLQGGTGPGPRGSTFWWSSLKCRGKVARGRGRGRAGGRGCGHGPGSARDVANDSGHDSTTRRACPQKRQERANYWGEFVIATVHPGGGDGPAHSVSCTCTKHKIDGERCNKSLAVGGRFTEAQALHRIKNWLARAYTIPDRVGARAEHMGINPG